LADVSLFKAKSNQKRIEGRKKGKRENSFDVIVTLPDAKPGEQKKERVEKSQPHLLISNIIIHHPRFQ